MYHLNIWSFSIDVCMLSNMLVMHEQCFNLQLLYCNYKWNDFHFCCDFTSDSLKEDIHSIYEWHETIYWVIVWLLVCIRFVLSSVVKHKGCVTLHIFCNKVAKWVLLTYVYKVFVLHSVLLLDGWYWCVMLCKRILHIKWALN